MDDVTKLDWRRWYQDRRSWPHSKEMFLAEAVLKLAPMLFFPWDDIVPPNTMADAAPYLPGPFEAFDEDGRPREGIHGTWAPAVLDYMSAAEYTSIRLRLEDPDAWKMAQVWDPTTRTMIFDPAKAYTTGHDVSYAHWNYASGQAAEINDLRAAGMRTMPLLARAMASMALNGDIKTFARPIAGGADVALYPEDWEVIDATPRLASCGVDIDDRRSVTTVPTHLIFVERENFDVHAWLYAERHMISLIEEGITPADVGMTGPKKPALFRALVNKSLAIMREHMQSDPSRYHSPVLRAAIEDRLGPVSDGVFGQARNMLRQQYPHISQGGAPPGTDRGANRVRFSLSDNVVPIGSAPVRPSPR